MVAIDLPYDKRTITAQIDDENYAGKLVSQAATYHNKLSEQETVEKSLDNPIGSDKLEELARGKHNIVIISSDHTRPVPSHIITPILLRRLRSVAPDARIRILVATGFHRPSTHEELVNFILADLDKAEIGLESYTPVSKNFPDLAVVYGLKAKVYMWDGQFAKAAEYARKAIDKSGATPMSESQWHNPTTGFNTATSAWMWYLHPTASNMGNLANFIGHISNEADWGYASLSKLQMARSLYDAIPATDFRKYSYLDPDRSTYAYQSVRGNAWLDEQPDYMSLKFRPVGGDYNTYSVGAAADIPVMRVEEMYLIEAEAVGASQDVAAGVQLLNNFMKQYRQSNYNFSTGDLRNFQLEVLKQMRIEFWGEGIAFPTAKRLKPDVIQNYEGTNFIEDIFKINCKGVKPNWTLMIPKTEVDSNTALQGMNNPDPSGAIAKRPTPIGEFAPGNN